MSTIPGGDEPREGEPISKEPVPAGPEPPSGQPEPPVVPEPPAPGAPGYPPPGGYPPPPPSYPSPSSYPPAGGFPPPSSSYPPPGYQAPPPGYPPQVPQQSLFGVALSDGWKAFLRVGWTFVGALVVWSVLAAAVLSIVSVIFGGWGKIADANGTGLQGFTGAAFSVARFVLGIVGGIVGAIVGAQFVRVALAVSRGHRPTFGEFFHFEDAASVAVLAVIIGVAEGVLSAIPFIGGLLGIVLGFFVMFAYYVLIDRRTAPVDAIRGSVDLVSRNTGQTIVFYVIAGLIIVAGFLVCGIGIFVATPVVILATAYLYRRLTGEQPQLPA